MHTNAGAVTALQQAVAHLSSALETLTNTDINMLMCTCSHMDTCIRLHTQSQKTCLWYWYRARPQAHARYFCIISGIDWTKSLQSCQVVEPVPIEWDINVCFDKTLSNEAGECTLMDWCQYLPHCGDAFKKVSIRVCRKHRMCDLTWNDEGANSVNAARCYLYVCGPRVNIDRVWYSFVLSLTECPLTRCSFAYFCFGLHFFLHKSAFHSPKGEIFL